MSACIHVYVHGRGRGHASRALRVVPALRGEGHRVRVFAGEDARAWLAPLGDVEPVDSLPADPSARTLWMLGRRVRGAMQAIARDDAALVISDGDVPGIWGAALTGRPRIAIGHGLLFDRFHRPHGVSHWPWRRERIKAWLSATLASRCIAVSFCPLDRRDPRAVLARSYDGLPPSGRSDGSVLCYFRDGAEPRVLAAIAARAPVELFAPTDPRVAGVRWRALDPQGFVATMLDARCVVGSAGSQLIGECLARGLPLFAIHADRDDEQRINVELLRGAGAGQGCARGKLDLAELARFVDHPPAVRSPGWTAPDVVAATLTAARELLPRGSGSRCAS